MMSSRERIVMLCTGARGGMRSVVDAYAADGLLRKWNVDLIFSNVEGGITTRLVSALYALVRFCCVLAGGRVRLVHIHMAMRGSFWRKSIFALICMAVRRPYLLHMHAGRFPDFYAGLPSGARRFVRWIVASADRVLVLSPSWATFYSGICPTARVAILPNYVVAPDLLVPASEGGVNCLFLGLVGEEKGVFDLLAAFGILVSSCPGLTLEIGGNGDLVDAGRRIADLGLAKCVRLHGWVDTEMKHRLFAACNVFVLPSHAEGLPMAILEAMAYGRPIVATRVGGIPDVVREGVDGLLVDARDASALAYALGVLSQDAGLRIRMGENARDRVAKEFSREVVLPRLEAIYNEFTAFEPRSTTS